MTDWSREKRDEEDDSDWELVLASGPSAGASTLSEGAAAAVEEDAVLESASFDSATAAEEEPSAEGAFTERDVVA